MEPLGCRRATGNEEMQLGNIPIRPALSPLTPDQHLLSSGNLKVPPSVSQLLFPIGNPTGFELLPEQALSKECLRDDAALIAQGAKQGPGAQRGWMHPTSLQAHQHAGRCSVGRWAAGLAERLPLGHVCVPLWVQRERFSLPLLTI